MPDKPQVLVIEDEAPVRSFLRAALTDHDYRVIEAETAREGLAQAAGRTPDVILLDLGLPDEDGIDATRKLRTWATIPIIVISARGREEDKVAALDAGADDYLTKPFSIPELLARIRVALRHVARGEGGESVVTLDDLVIDLGRRVVTLGEQEVHLTPTEYKLLAALAKFPGRVLTYKQLHHELWGAHAATQMPALRVYMTQLRHKIERQPARPVHLMTEPGVGYRLRDA